MKTIIKIFITLLVIEGCSTSHDNNDRMMVVSADKMNVLYVGVDNPVSIAVSDVPASNISVKMDEEEGKISGQNGRYIIRVSKAGEVTLDVSGEVDGKKVPFAPVKFRSKLVPDPVASFAGKTGTDIISAAELQQAQEVTVMFQNFDFDLKFQVVSFSVSMAVNKIEVEEFTNGDKLTENQKKLLTHAEPGTKIYIENVKAKGPDGSIRTIGSVNLKVL